MKTLFFSLCTLLLFSAKAQTPDLTVENGMLKFSTLVVYEQYADNTLDRNNITNATSSLMTLAKQSPVSPVDEGADAIEEDTLYPEFLKTILNTDKIFGIGNFFVKIDLENHRALVIAANASNAYNTLVTNNTADAGVLLFNDDEDDAIDVLDAVSKGDLTVNQFNTATEAQRLSWPWNSCSGAGRHTAKVDDYWSIVPNESCTQSGQYAYFGDDKLVYQKAVFYFSLETKAKSRKGCTLRPGIFAHSAVHYADIQIQSQVKYVKVSHCRREENYSLNNYQHHREYSWRPYEGSKALSKYEMITTFGFRHNSSTPTFWLSPQYRIASGY